MNYSDTINYLFTHLPMFQRTGPAAYKNKLGNTLELDEKYGTPHKQLKTIHVAGTNGKGSVSHMLAAIFQSAGYKTGLYTSPHLNDFRERIKINGEMISKNEVTKWVEDFKINNEAWKIEPSFFELTVAMAFNYFAKNKVDIAIIEVGLGGRLDSTNIISPELSVITNIGFDHTALLGDTLKKIATEKAGIIKPETPVVIGTTQSETKGIFTTKAKKTNSRIYFADQEYFADYAMADTAGKQVITARKGNDVIFPQLKLDLKGFYQLKNLPAVLKSIELMQAKGWAISEKNIYTGLAETTGLTGLKGRWQEIGNNPRIVCDTGHNEDGIKQIVEQIKQTPFKNLHIVLGVVNDKDPEKILALLPQNATYYFTRAQIPRSLNENSLKEIASRFNLRGKPYPAVSEAVAAAKKNAGENDFIFIGGSTFVVAEIF